MYAPPISRALEPSSSSSVIIGDPRVKNGKNTDNTKNTKNTEAIYFRAKFNAEFRYMYAS